MKTSEMKEYQKKELTSDSKDTGLQVGDTVDWMNDNGVKWRHKVIGFNYSNLYNKEYKKYVHLDTDSYWFPHNHENLKKIN